MDLSWKPTGLCNEGKQATNRAGPLMSQDIRPYFLFTFYEDHQDKDQAFSPVDRSTFITYLAFLCRPHRLPKNLQRDSLVEICFVDGDIDVIKLTSWQSHRGVLHPTLVRGGRARTPGRDEVSAAASASMMGPSMVDWVDGSDGITGFSEVVEVRRSMTDLGWWPSLECLRHEVFLMSFLRKPFPAVDLVDGQEMRRRLTVLSLRETLAAYGSVHYIRTIIPIVLILISHVIKPTKLARSKNSESQAWSYKLSRACPFISHIQTLLTFPPRCFISWKPTSTPYSNPIHYFNNHISSSLLPLLFALTMEFGNDPKSNPISRAGGKAPVKVKYISSPIHVSARDACEFKAVVQQLTGQKSEVPSPACARMMVTNGAGKLRDHEGLTRTKPAALQPSGCDKFSNATALVEFGEDFSWRETSETLFNFQFPSQHTFIWRFFREEGGVMTSIGIRAIESQENIDDIRDVNSPKEVWKTLARLFTKKNTARLQLLENELVGLTQGGVVAEDHANKSAAFSASVNYETECIIDSGSSHHVTGNDSLFPKLHQHSGDKVTNSRKYVLFGPEDVKIFSNVKSIAANVLVVSEKKDSLFVMSAVKAYVEKTGRNDGASIWHARFGNVGYQMLQQISSKKLIDGIPII
ncbi:hypothetical protein RJ639_022263 [Escallonia herrerae]|uniref:VQ domain-containing protein n=1 Tax=Escallonia herrerae TaxID=1293975 RepID=A0AA88V344_9ASTE|nr:hypothetical protein RJ639_022263 [Escallonia herrerae]